MGPAHIPIWDWQGLSLLNALLKRQWETIIKMCFVSIYQSYIHWMGYMDIYISILSFYFFNLFFKFLMRYS